MLKDGCSGLFSLRRFWSSRRLATRLDSCSSVAASLALLLSLPPLTANRRLLPSITRFVRVSSSPAAAASQEIVFRNQSLIINHVQERKCRLPFTFIPSSSRVSRCERERDANLALLSLLLVSGIPCSALLPVSLRRIALTLVIDSLQSLSRLYCEQPQERERERADGEIVIHTNPDLYDESENFISLRIYLQQSHERERERDGAGSQGVRERVEGKGEEGGRDERSMRAIHPSCSRVRTERTRLRYAG